MKGALDSIELWMLKRADYLPTRFPTQNEILTSFRSCTCVTLQESRSLRFSGVLSIRNSIEYKYSVVLWFHALVRNGLWDIIFLYSITNINQKAIKGYRVVLLFNIPADVGFLAMKKFKFWRQRGTFNNDSHNNIDFLFFHFNFTYFSTKFNKDMFFDYNDVDFNARLSLLK